MLSGVQERKLRIIRGVLVLGWLAIIASLFWDPLTPELTRPDNLASPFHLHDTVVVQGVAWPETPYAMTNRIFWTMIIPILPLFFMVAGHETWRRLCPLSFVSQIPRYLGWQRKKKLLSKRTGAVERQLALIDRSGWLSRNVWYIQFGLLFLALNIRILFVNSDRTSLAIFFIAAIIIALAVGYFWGGKTWCNYFCPIAIVQKIYTEPRGIFESEPHLKRSPITQSMCRTTTPEGERSICVGCTSHCPDIDLERSYWERIEDSSLRHVYYAFFGLIVGFYSWYYLYSGTWDYYFSGVWTHEPDQVGNLFKPGLYLNGQAIGIPKILAAPLVLGEFVALAVLLGLLLERIYRHVLSTTKSTLSEPEIINRCLSFSAYVSINSFYLFGGRPNLMLLPSPALRAVDILIVALTTLWFWRATQRSPLQYRRESLSTSLLEQLQKLKVDVSKYMEGRKLEQLKPDEIYILAKTLPGFSREQRLLAYRNILEDALRTGKADSSSSIGLLRDVRIEIDVSEDEHRQLLEELGIDGADSTLDAGKAANYENWLRKNNYRQALEPLVVAELEKGSKLADILTQEQTAKLIQKYREQYQITEEEHQIVLTEITGVDSMILDRAKEQIEALRHLAELKFHLQCYVPDEAQWEDLSCILQEEISRRTALVCVRIFPTLLTLGNTRESRWIARSSAALAGSDIDAALARKVSVGASSAWGEAIDPVLTGLLRGEMVAGQYDADELPPTSYREVVNSDDNLAKCLGELSLDRDETISALALYALMQVDSGYARQTASSLNRTSLSERQWLLREVSDITLGIASTENSPQTHSLSITTVSANGSRDSLNFSKDYVSVGRAQDNDIVLSSQFLTPYHLGILREKGQLWVRRASRAAEIYIDGQLWSGEGQIQVPHNAPISFSPPQKTGPILLAELVEQPEGYTREHYSTLSRLLWLSHVPIFKAIDLSSLAEIAKAAEVRLYDEGALLCRTGDVSSDAFLIQSGSVDVIKEDLNGRRQPRVLSTLTEGAIVGELGVITGHPRTATVRVATRATRVVTINGERLHSLLRNDADVSFGMLSTIAGYFEINPRHELAKEKEAA